MNMISAKLHPVHFAAAVSVIVLSITGIAAITGHLPGATSSPAAQGASAPPAPQSPASATRGGNARSRSAAVPCTECGVIEEIRAVQVTGEASGLGAAAGGVTGALLGSQIGRHDGRTLATIAGAAGGAYAGNAIEKNMNKRVVHRVALRMDDGTRRTVTLQQQPAFAVGERVRVLNDYTLARV